MQSTNENLLVALVALRMGCIDEPEFLESLDAGQLNEDGSFLETLKQSGRASSEKLKDLADRVSEIRGVAPKFEHDIKTETYRPDIKADAPAVPAQADNGMQRYQAIRIHDRGGLGQVWLARDCELGRDVALKEILPEKAELPGVQQLFAREAQITANLEHPSIVPVYGFGQNECGRPCYAMRFITNKTLKSAIQEYHSLKGDPSFRAVRFLQLLNSFVDVCQAVQCAHTHGIVHRDIKPHNIVLGEFGEAYLLDWGLAFECMEPASESPSAAESSRNKEKSEQNLRSVVGTPMYMSPEQASGQQIGPPSDIYSLGATLYELLTGFPPFTSVDHKNKNRRIDIHQLLNKVKSGDFPRPRDRGVDVDDELEHICLKAMAIRPDDRYRSATELVSAIERFQTELPLRHWRRAVRHFEDLRREEPDELEFQLSLGRSLHSLGVACWGQQRFDESIQHLVEAVEIFEKLNTLGNDASRDLAGVYLSLSRVNAQVRDKAEALRHYKQAQSWLTRYLHGQKREASPALLMQMFEPSDVGFMRYLREQ